MHHANIVESSNFDCAYAHISKICRDALDIDTTARSALDIVRVETFGIPESRALTAKVGMKGFSNAPQIYVIASVIYTHAAQNALLKTLEEPPEHTYFFIIVPERDALLKTVQSRCVFVRAVPEEDATHDVALEFFSHGIVKRMQYVSDMLTSLKKGSIARAEVLQFFDSLEAIAYEKNNKDALQVIMRARKYARMGGSSMKQLLEYVALRL